MTRSLQPACLVFLPLLLGLGAIGPSPGVAAAQQASLKDTVYTSPSFGYSIRWNANAWEVVHDIYGGGADLLALSDAHGTDIVFSGIEEFAGDARRDLPRQRQPLQMPAALRPLRPPLRQQRRMLPAGAGVLRLSLCCAPGQRCFQKKIRARKHRRARIKLRCVPA